MTATYINRALEVTVPYHGVHQGVGHLEVTLLSPEDKILARSESIVKTTAANGIWQTKLTPDHNIPFDDLVWERIRSRVSFESERTPAMIQVRSVSTILRHPVVHLLGQTHYLTGAPAALRVIVTDGTPNAAPLTNGTLRIELPKQSAPTVLFDGKLDHHGSTNAEFRFPADLTGDTSLRIIAETPLGTAETTETVHLEDKISILLTTEKPIYQPSQTIHVRALALDRAAHPAASSRKLTFELEDARGNRVFRKETSTDSFGVASAEFALADEVNFGAWHLHALIPSSSEAANNTAELTLQVQRYVLPKFRVSINFTQSHGKPSAAVETTGLAVQALLRSNGHNGDARKALTWLLSKKSGDGNWGSTQATIMALRALVMASEKAGGDALGTLDILLNGQPFKNVPLTKENNDLLQQFVLPASSSDRVELRFHGTGGLAYQIDARYFIPWSNHDSKDGLSIDVAYDRTRLAESNMVTATATIRNNLGKQANMVMVDLGIPPGFELQTEDLQTMVENTAHARVGKLEKFNLTATQAILYFDGIGPGQTVKVHFRLRAKYPIRVKAFASRIYEYYDPAISATTRPVTFEVVAR